MKRERNDGNRTENGRRGYEKSETQTFWNDLLHSVLGVENTIDYIKYEKNIKMDNVTKFADGYIPGTRVLIEQKSRGIDLTKQAK